MQKNEKYDNLFKEILKLETLDECYKFFDDLCTIKEVDSMAQRIEAAKMLLQNETYEEIISKTKISSTTLSRISKCIHYGEGGYKNILTKNDEEHK